MLKKQLTIGNLKPTFPIIQGGMGVGISLSSLAGHVAKCGGIGIISGAQIGYREKDFIKNPLRANLDALKHEIQLAREIAPDGIIGVNLMVAMKHYAEYVKKAVEEKIDLIISGAGLPLDLPKYTKDTHTKAIPIVSSAKAANIICKQWDRKYNFAPDAIIVEGPLAGGHLGFSASDLEECPPLVEDILQEVKVIAQEYGAKYNKSIPVIVAGGVYDGTDVQHMLEIGADGIQMATRFVTTYECDAHLAFKEAYINSTPETIGIIKSPVGMPGRAILNPYVTNPAGNKACFYDCLHKCGITDIPYCISKALIHAVIGDTENALLFCGSNAYKATKLEHVKDIFEEIQLAIC
ncbi:MAG: nitronate monooxygenase [Niameybacter sp.]|uniref:NAD(P)H-dependent flavin oxidoreductase n=1 Tax=Niameybacter sp. TaxID=2033640 RepID=UPI002FCB035C